MPQVTILEGGKPKSFAGVDKLQIALSGGGTSLWVPKDTRLLTALTANVNGTYPPPEGYFGFDTVIVNVPPSQVAGIDPETGQYVLVGTKKTESEDPKWPTTPNQDDDPYDPDNPDGYGWDPWEDTDPWDKDPYKDDWDEGEKEMTETHIPSGIKIIVPPNKASYTEGEPMDYSGISVQLVDENGGLFTNDKYQNGLVPFSELVFPITHSPHGGESEHEASVDKDTLSTVDPDGWLTQPIAYTISSTAINNNGTIVYTFNEPIKVLSVPLPSVARVVAPIFFSKTPFKRASGASGEWVDINYHVIINGKPVYYFYTTVVENYYKGIPNNIISDTCSNEEYALVRAAYIALYGDVTYGNAKIPVQWVSPYDGVTYTDMFPITVTGEESDPEGGGGGFSGGGGEGIGGEGGGGGF